MHELTCADQCLDVIECKNMTGNYEPKFTDCTCDKGTPVKLCSSVTLNNCDPLGCDVDHYYNEVDKRRFNIHVYTIVWDLTLCNISILNRL